MMDNREGDFVAFCTFLAKSRECEHLNDQKVDPFIPPTGKCKFNSTKPVTSAEVFHTNGCRQNGNVYVVVQNFAMFT